MRTNPKIISDGELDKEYNLSAITVERIDLVDEPCVPKAVIRIIKNKEDITVAEEKDKLELTEEEQEQLEKSLADAAKLIQTEMGKVKDEKKKKRLNLILASLKGLTKQEDDDDEEEEEDKEKKNKVKKSDGDGEEETEDLETVLKNEFLAEIKEDLTKELKEEVEKAGRSISRKTASELEKIVATIKNALSSLESITKPGQQHDGPKKDEYEDKYPKPKKKATKKSREELDLTDLQKQAKKTYELYKNDQIDDAGRDEFVDGLFDIMKSLQEEYINENEEGGE